MKEKSRDDDDFLRELLVDENSSSTHNPLRYTTANQIWRRKKQIVCTLIGCALFSVAVASIGVFMLAQKKQAFSAKQLTPSAWMDCGHSPEEARARGCHYEAMQRSWIPDACYFPEPGEEYRPFRDRQWFLDGDLTQPATEEVLTRLESGDERLAFAEYFHDEHCVYAWRKLHLAIQMRKSYIDSKTFDMHHTTHCSQRIADVLFHSENSTVEHYMDGVTESPLMFQTCILLPWKDE
jgi:hypothetical protein